MKNTLIVVGGVIIAYALYMKWLENERKKKAQKVDVKAVVNEAIVNARKNNTTNSVPNNFEAFSLMRKDFNAEESSTVAPSIKAKKGIF
jgi:flagellar motor component MotA